MKSLTRGGALALLLALATTAPAQNYFYYSPRPVSAEEKGQLKGGVLVREITIRKGDTLSRLSRRFSGKGSYFPQILLFNDIKNPDLIYSGDLLRVPLTKSEAAQQHSGAAAPNPKEPVAAEAQPPSPADIKQPVDDKAIKTASTEAKRQKRQAAKKRRRAAADSSSLGDTKAGQRLFEEALKSYRRDDCRKSLELFERFLAEHPASPLAADASLYKADCYLKLSAE